LIIAIGAGFIIGFLKVKINHILVIFTGKLQTSKHSRQRYIVFGVASSILFFILYYLLTPSPELILGIIFTAIYAVMYTVGVVIAENRFEQHLTILETMISAMFTDSTKGDKITSDAFRISKQMLDNMSVSNREVLLLLLLFFDSRFVVFFVSLFIERRFTLTRFVNMNSAEQDEYLNTWNNTRGLDFVIKALKAITSFPYYTSSLSWNKIGYDGNVLKKSYLH
jgi:hypothetical protein